MGDYRCLTSDGQTIGRYRVLREIGRGGMGVVFEAIHLELGKRVALKMLEVGSGNPANAHERFIREARAAAQAHHLHAVGVYDIGTHHGRAYIVMELLEGETLADLIAREAPLAASRIAELLLPILSAVAAAHDAGVVHRDLKPANIVLARRGGTIRHPVVTDFGVSKIIDQSTSTLTCSHAILGTIHYMAPELTRSAEHATPLSDSYSLGVILYECATGRRPFTGSSPYELMHAIVIGACPRPTELCADLHPGMEAILLRAMHKDPEARFSSVRALGAALLSFANAKTWAIWADEFEAAAASIDATHPDPPDSRRLVAQTDTPVIVSRHSRRVSLPRAALPLLGLVLFGSGWITAQIIDVPRLQQADAAANQPRSAAPGPLSPTVVPIGSNASDATPPAASSPSNPGLEADMFSSKTELRRNARTRRALVQAQSPSPVDRAQPVGSYDVVSAMELGSNGSPIIE